MNEKTLYDLLEKAKQKEPPNTYELLKLLSDELSSLSEKIECLENESNKYGN